MRILLTGASGFLGKHVLHQLQQKRFEITVLIRDAEKAKTLKLNQNTKLFVSDLKCADLTSLNLHDTTLIHLAWDYLENYDDQRHYEALLPDHYNFIKSTLHAGVKQVLVSGTCFEYGLINGPIKASQKTEPVTCYGFAKDSLHSQLRHLQRNEPFKLQWARLFFLHGEQQRSTSLLGQLESVVKNGHKDFQMSLGEQLRDYLPVSRAAEKIVELALNANDGCFNVCSGQPISVRRLVENKLQNLGANLELKFAQKSYPDHEPMAFWGVND